MADKSGVDDDIPAAVDVRCIDVVAFAAAAAAVVVDDGSEHAAVDGHDLLSPKSHLHLQHCHLRFHGHSQSSATEADDIQSHREPRVDQDVIPAWKQMYHHRQQLDPAPKLASMTPRVVFHVVRLDADSAAAVADAA